MLITDPRLPLFHLAFIKALLKPFKEFGVLEYKPLLQGKIKPDSMLDLFLYPLLFVMFVTITTRRMLSIAKSIHNGLPRGALPL